METVGECSRVVRLRISWRSSASGYSTFSLRRKAVELGFRQRVGALHFDRILRVASTRKGLGIECCSPATVTCRSCMASSKSALGLRSGTIDLVR